MISSSRASQKWLISLFLSLWISPRVLPQENIRFQNISSEQGLSQSAVFGITQDSQGFMWFGTEEGANRYNGYEMRIFRPERGNPTTISNNWINCIIEDRQGKIWFGTDNGLNCFDRETERFRHFMAQPDNPEALLADRIYALMEDKDGILWIGTDSGLHTLSQDRARMTRIPFPGTNRKTTAENDIRAVIQDQEGSIWVGTFGGGIRRRDAKTLEWTRYIHHPSQKNSLGNNDVLCLRQDREGFIWIGTQGGLDRLDLKSQFFFHYVHDPKNASSLSVDRINCLFEDNGGALWIGTQNGGLNLYHRETDGFTHSIHDSSNPSSLRANHVLSIHQDRSGLLWIGTYGGGLDVFQKNAVRFLHVRKNPPDPLSISNNQVRSFLEDGPDRLFIGTQADGINILDRKKGKTIVLTHRPDDPTSLSDNQVYSIVKDKQGTIWMGTIGGGLNRFHPSDRTFTRFQHRPDDLHSLSHNRIRTLCPSRNGGLWIGTDGRGINFYSPETGRFTRYSADPQNPDSLSLDRVFSLAEDPRSGILWIGTFGGGLDRWDPQTGIFRHFKSQPENPNSLGHNYVLCIHIDKQGILWIGTNGGGLTRFDPVLEVFKSYTQDDGLANNTVYGILEDDEGNLWMSTNQGLSKFNPRHSAFKKYDLSDGLQDLEFDAGSFHRGESGRMYFGGINGYNVFEPQSIADNPFIPPVVLTGVQLFNKDVGIGEKIDGREILSKAINVTQEITLSYKDRVVSFEFAALSFLAPEKNQYAYQMEGLDPDWNRAGARRYASYTNLPPGSYRFIVKASNNDGLWNETGTAISITVVPPFWQTWLFRTISILFCALIVLSVFGLRIRSIDKKRKELESVVQLRTKELNEAYREVEKLSITDALTGLYNRHFFFSRIDKDAALVLRQNSRRNPSKNVFSLSFLMIDLDFFKKVNDHHGHDMGDKLLKEIAGRFLSTIRAGDILVRWGGEEFLLMSKENDFEFSQLLAQRLLTAVHEEPFRWGETEVNMTISIGFCSLPLLLENPLAFSWEETLKLADQALYIAKHSGRNRAVGIKIDPLKLDPENLKIIKSDVTKALENRILEIVTVIPPA